MGAGRATVCQDDKDAVTHEWYMINGVSGSGLQLVGIELPSLALTEHLEALQSPAFKGTATRCPPVCHSAQVCNSGQLLRLFHATLEMYLYISAGRPCP